MNETARYDAFLRHAGADEPAAATTELRLEIESLAGGLRATWIGKDDRPSFELSGGLDAEDMADHRWYLEEYLRFPGPGDHARARAFEQRLDAFGRELFDAVQKEGGAEALRDLMAAPEPRLLTISSEDADALALPWELLRDGRGPLVFRDLVIRRRLPSVPSVTAGAVASVPLRLLLVVARPTDVGFIDPRSSAEPLLDALDALGGLVRVDLCEPPTLAELERRLDEAKDRGEGYHLVHFDGHGQYVPEEAMGVLYFEGTHSIAHPVKGPELGDLLARHQVPVVLLEACQTADLANAPVFGSVAPALLRSGVGSVVAFSHSVMVSGSRILVEHFYEALCAGKSVGEALGAGRRALSSDPVRMKTRRGDLTLHDWHIAELYQAGDDPRLVPSGAPASMVKAAVPLQRGREPSEDFDTAPLYGFHGQARRLFALQRRLAKRSAVVLTGMGGMGKTSLAREAARWWHRIGLRPGGAAFFSFESRQGADRAVEAFVGYFEGGKFVKRAPEEQWARAVELFRSEPVLWVWDNFESTLPQYQKNDGSLGFAEEERDKLGRLFDELTRGKGGKPKGWLLVTCRPEGTGLGGIAEIGLEGLAKSDALAMARVILERKDVAVGSVGYERERIEEVLDALGGHPLSIELVMPHLKAIGPVDILKELRRLISGLTQSAKEGRNESLLASLAFSTKRLGEAARGVLPYLAWFDEGAFEQLIIDFSALSPEVWAGVRAELLATALVQVDEAVLLAGRPYLRFHPTLPYAAAPEAVADQEGAAKRFVEVYYALAGVVYKALRGAEPAGAMKVMAREEGNLRRAVAIAFERGEYEAGAGIADTVGVYLAMAGRVRDQERLSAWVRAHMTKAAAGPAKWNAELDHAWGLFLAGKAKEAILLLHQQLAELDKAGADGRQQALCQLYLGRIWLHAGQPQHALEPLAAAIEGFEATGDPLNLSAALGDQANALRALGRHVDALSSAERAVAFSKEQGDARSEAAGLVPSAAILMDQHRFSEAEQRYQEALDAARRAGDAGLEGSVLQHMGSLADDQGDYACAVAQYKEALARFQALDDRAAEMQTADMLGTAEMKLGHHEAARAWYAEGERLARALGNEEQLGATAQNLGILLQEQALALPEDAKAERQRLLGEAVTSVETSLALKRKRGDEVSAAASLSQLGLIHKDLGALDEAERFAHEALATRERLGLPDVWKDYWTLEDIAAARDNAAEAAAWRAKKEAKLAELDRLAQGDGPPRLPPDLRDALLALRQVVHAARTTNRPLSPDAAESIANLSSYPAPLPAAGHFLAAVASGALPPIPADLPPELAEILTALTKALAD